MSWKSRVSVRVIYITLSLLALSPCPQASEEHAFVPTPDQLPGATKVDAEGVIETLARIPGLVIIDSRISMDRKQGYIESAISLPDNETDCGSLEVLLDELDTPVLFYCNGPKCGRSVKAIHKAQACGYRNVYWFRGGFEEWTAKGYPFLKE